MYSRAILFLFLVLVFVSLLSPSHSSNVRSKRHLGLSIQLGDVLGTPTSSTPPRNVNRVPPASHAALPVDTGNLGISIGSRPNMRPSQTVSDIYPSSNRNPVSSNDQLNIDQTRGTAPNYRPDNIDKSYSSPEYRPNVNSPQLSSSNVRPSGGISRPTSTGNLNRDYERPSSTDQQNTFNEYSNLNNNYEQPSSSNRQQPSNQASKDNRLPASEFDRVTDYDRPKGPPSHANPYGGSGPPGLNGQLPPGLAKDKPNRPGGNRPDSEEVDQGTRCKGNQFHCGSGECLPKHMRCDGRFDCRDSSDEQDCSGNPTQQGSTEKPLKNQGRCTLPEQPVGGNYELGGCDRPCHKKPGDKVPGNSILTYSCRDGYSLSGNTISVCVNDSWYMPPTCQKTCPPLNSTSVDIKCKYKGEIVSCNEKIKPGTKAELSCKDSYKLSLTNDPGYREVTCLEEGLWDRTVFRCLPECGTAVAHGNTLVVHGFDAKLGVFPWHVGIYDKQSGAPNREPEQICAGTLISGNLVVSAAHCFYDEANGRVRSPTNFAVAAGKHYRSWNAQENYVQKSDVEEIELTDRYIGARGNFAQDIALIKLNKSFELTALVRPVCLDWENSHEREQLQVGKFGKAVGWGKTIEGIPSENLQEVNLPFIPYDQCLSSVPEDFRGYITADKFCAGHMNGSSLCEGDSGGGLCFEMNKIWYLRGVVSVSPVRDGSCDYHSYVGFTYVSYFRDWIRATYIKT